MPCNLINFISVNRESEVGQGQRRGERERNEKERKKKKKGKKGREKERKEWSRKTPAGEERSAGGGIGYHHHRFDSVQRCPVGSVSVQERKSQRGWGQAARRWVREQESSKEHVLLFYSGICPCSEHVHIRAVRAICAAHLDKSCLAGPRATPRASAFLQVIVAVFSEVWKRRQWQCRDNQFVVVFYRSKVVRMQPSPEWSWMIWNPSWPPICRPYADQSQNQMLHDEARYLSLAASASFPLPAFTSKWMPWWCNLPARQHWRSVLIHTKGSCHTWSSSTDIQPVQLGRKLGDL